MTSRVPDRAALPTGLTHMVGTHTFQQVPERAALPTGLTHMVGAHTFQQVPVQSKIKKIFLFIDEPKQNRGYSKHVLFKSWP